MKKRGFNSTNVGSPSKKGANSKVLGDYHLAKINKIFEDFWIMYE